MHPQWLFSTYLLQISSDRYQASSTDVLARITRHFISREACLEDTTDNFNIHDIIPAPSNTHHHTRASHSGKFKHKLCRIVASHQFYLNRMTMERPSPNWLITLISKHQKKFYSIFFGIISSNQTPLVHIILCAHAPPAHLFPTSPTIYYYISWLFH